MPNTNTVVAMFESQADAERAIHTLDKADFNIKAISLVGEGAHTAEGKIMLVASGSVDEVEQANAVLQTAPGATDVHMHFADSAVETVG
jgi:hypothetical protein